MIVIVMRMRKEMTVPHLPAMVARVSDDPFRRHCLLCSKKTLALPFRVDSE